MNGHLDDRQLEAVLDGADLAPVRGHLDGCARCRAALATRRELRAVRQAARSTLTAEQSARMAQRFMQAIAQPPPARAAGWRLSWQLGAAAALAATAAVLALVLTRPAGDDAAGAAIAALPAVEAPAPGTAIGIAPVVAAVPNAALHGSDQVAAPRPTAAPGAIENTGSAPATQPPPALRRSNPSSRPPAAAQLASVDTSTLLRERATLLTQSGQFEQAADVYLASLAAAQTAAEIEPALADYKALVKLHARELEPRAIAVRAEYIASLALPAPYAEEAGYLACENALAAKSYASAYQLCHRYLELFGGSARTRDVAYLTASVARLYLGDCQSAIELYTQALVFSGTLQSLNDEAYLGRALCYTQLGQLAAARRDLDLYLHKRPDQLESAAVRDLTRRLQDGRQP